MNNNLNLKKPKSKLRKLNSVVALVGVATVATIGSLFYRNSVDKTAESRLSPYIEQNEILSDSLNQTNLFLEDFKEDYSNKKKEWKNKLNNREKTIVELNDEKTNLILELTSLENMVQIPELTKFDSNREYIVTFDNGLVEFSYGTNSTWNNVEKYKQFMSLIDVLYAAEVNKEYLDLFITRHNRNYPSTITIEKLTESNIRDYIGTRDELKSVKKQMENCELSIVNFTFDNGSKQIQYELIENLKLENLYSGGIK